MITIWNRKCLRVLIFAICVVVIWNFVSVYWIMEVRLPTQIQVVIAKKEGEVILVGRKQPKQTTAASTVIEDAIRPKICENCFHTKFRYIVESDVCTRNTSKNASILLLVFSKHENRNQRNALRRTWLSQAKGNVTYTFVFGKSTMEELNYNIADEQKIHYDIVLIDFIESYRNLTLKTISAFRWAVKNCGHVNYVMKVDDDMWVNLEALQEMVTSPLGLSTNKLFGSCSKNARPFRDPTHKYYVPFSMYNESIYPPYCSGTGYLSHMALIKEVVNLSSNIPFFPLEDIYIALCLQHLGYKTHNIGEFHAYKVYPHPCLYRSNIVITSHGVTANELKMIWKANCKAQIRAWMGMGVRGGGLVPLNSHYEKVEVIQKSKGKRIVRGKKSINSFKNPPLLKLNKYGRHVPVGG